MGKLEEVRETLKTLMVFLTPAIPFVNSHLNSFFMDSLWEYHLSERLRGDLEALSIPELKDVIRGLANGGYCGNCKDLTSVSFETGSFQEIICGIGQLLLASKNLSVRVDDFKVEQKREDSESVGSQCNDPVATEPKESKWSSWKFDPFMSPKKLHEVEVMSEFIVRVADLQGIQSVGDRGGTIGATKEGSAVEFLIDVGSGKGYLSSFLSLLYGFNVLALDSSSVNTSGCTKRSTTLQKNWSSFLRRAQEAESKHGGGVSKRGKHWKSKMGGIDGEKMIGTTEIKAERGITDESGKLMGTAVSMKSSGDAKNDVNCNSEKLKTVTLFVNEDLDLLQLLHDNFVEYCDEVTHPSLGIIGLHTCGQLGVDSVKLFCNSKHARFLVNVPCCYHLLNEQYHKNEEDFAGRKYIPAFEGDAPGFPLSQTLQAESFYLGRNARMMSAQSLHRMSVEEDELNIPRPLLYRALLQVLIRQKLGHTALETSVGRLGSKFEDFQQYVRKAWTKLQLENVPLSTEEIEALYQTHGARKERFHKYFLLRALFAPLIERCILLDRLAYLLEQGDVHEAFIVELFDPFLSPRCHALVSVR